MSGAIPLPYTFASIAGIILSYTFATTLR